MEITLNIYKKEKGKKIVDKSYTAKDYNVSFGVLEDLINLMQGINENENDDMTMIKHVSKVMNDIKPLMLDVFDGLTEEELRRADTSEVLNIGVTLIMYGLGSLGAIGSKKKV